MVHVLAFYSFTPIENPDEEVRRHKEFFSGRDVTSRIYISHEGINGQMSASPFDSMAYQEWLKSDPRFAKVEFKVDDYPEHVFPRLCVKARRQLVALDKAIDTQEGGEHVAPQEWKKMLEARDEDTVLLDVRNDYEWKVGHFEGADLPTMATFREFPEWVEEFKKTRDTQKTKVMMYCTGGIRCELYSVLFKEAGFEKVYQLEGGVIKYGHEVGRDHFKGKLFVFDDRMAVPIAQDGKDEVISVCAFCGVSSDTYYNCANMKCNALFLGCVDCAEKMQGCCSLDCMSADTLRPYVKGPRPKPFRRKHFLTSTK